MSDRIEQIAERHKSDMADRSYWGGPTIPLNTSRMLSDRGILLEEIARLKAERDAMAEALPETFAGWVWTDEETAQLRAKHEHASEHKGYTEMLYAMAAEGIRIARKRALEPRT